MERGQKRKARRWVVGPTLGWLNLCGRPPNRWEKEAENHRAFLSRVHRGHWSNFLPELGVVRRSTKSGVFPDPARVPCRKGGERRESGTIA